MFVKKGVECGRFFSLVKLLGQKPFEFVKLNVYVLAWYNKKKIKTLWKYVEVATEPRLSGLSNQRNCRYFFPWKYGDFN